jgi:hypothetical protein
MTEGIITGVAIFVIGGIIATLSRHITNDDKHPSKKDIVFRNVCEVIHKGESTQMKDINDKLDDHKRDYIREFAEIKDLIIRLDVNNRG